MSEKLKIEVEFTPLELFKELQHIKSKLIKLGDGLKEMNYSMVGDPLLSTSLKLQDAQDIIID